MPARTRFNLAICFKASILFFWVNFGSDGRYTNPIRVFRTLLLTPYLLKMENMLCENASETILLLQVAGTARNSPNLALVRCNLAKLLDDVKVAVIKGDLSMVSIIS